MLKAGIAGLGQVGLLFDEDNKRRGVWTHFSAYERLSRDFELVAACEPDTAKRRKALARLPQLHVYSSLGSMLENERLDVISLCTPPTLHASQILACAGRVRGIICEKPFGTDVSACQKALDRCKREKTHLTINYYKRFEGSVHYAHEWITRRKRMGPYSMAQGIYSGPLEAVGSHMVDLLSFFLGTIRLVKAWRGPGPDNSYSALFTGVGGLPVILLGSGPRHKLVFEMDFIGTKGRCRILENCDKLELGVFKASRRYDGYEELIPQPEPKYTKDERFLPLFKEMAFALKGHRISFTCDGESALRTQKLLTEIREN